MAVKEQIQQILSYVQEGLANMWKENTLKDLEGELLEYEIAREFLVEIRKEFEEGNRETVNVVKLKRIEQGRRTIEEFI